MASFHSCFVLVTLCLFLIKSELNDTNSTYATTTLSPITTTAFYTSISPTSNPTINPTASTQSPSLTPPSQKCSFIYAKVISTHAGTWITNGEEISSYPVNYGPLAYQVSDTPIISFSNMPNPCNIATFNASLIQNKIVLMDGTQNTQFCDYKQWTLNFQHLGANALLIGMNGPFPHNYKGNDGLNEPNIATRFISNNAYNNLKNDFEQGIDVKLALDCAQIDIPQYICVEDDEFDSSSYNRIIGGYELVNDSVYGNSSNPIWRRLNAYNFASDNNEWNILFDTDTYFNWCIGLRLLSNTQIIAYCNDSIKDSPSQCSQWRQSPVTSPLFYKSDSLMLRDGQCSNGNESVYCIQTLSSDLSGFEGNYRQLMNNRSEWFYEDAVTKNVAVLYWTEINGNVFQSEYGWIIAIGQNVEAYCPYSEKDLSLSKNESIFYPNLCPQWLDASKESDASFDIDANVCFDENAVIDSNVSLLCLQHSDSVYSGVYKRELLSISFSNHRVWSLSVDNDIFSFLYYDISDGWILTKNQNLNSINANNPNNFYVINDEDILAKCMDENGQTDNPTACVNEWSTPSDGVFNLTIIGNSEQCQLPIFATSEPQTSETLNDDNGGQNGDELLFGLGTTEYIGIGALLLVFPICILCFVCYQKKKSQNPQTQNGKNEHGIALQPYVPATITTKKDVAGSTNEEDGTCENTMDSTNALINVFDDDMAPQQVTNGADDDNDNDDDFNPFMRNSILRSGMTIDETTKMSLNGQDIMSAFDE